MTPDALTGHWSHKLPAPWRALAQLSRLDRPVGWRLLWLPCLMGLALARTGEAFQPQDAWLALAFLVGAIAARGAGCTYNDIIDRDIDAQVARTAARPLPSGAISAKGAWAWLGAQILVCFAVLPMLPRPAALACFAAVPLVGAYPFMKRITWWPQAWLGLCFSWGALVAGVSLGPLSPALGFLYLGAVLWVIGYDTLYALQDVEDDALVGVRSTARLFGARWRLWTMGLFLASGACWLAAAALAGAGPFSVCILAPLSLALWRLRGLDGGNAKATLAAFRANAAYGGAITLCLALEPLLRTFAEVGSSL